MLLKLLKLNANDAIRSGAVATRSSGSVTLRNTCSAAGAVDPCRLRQLLGDRLQRARADEEPVREAEPDVDEDARHLRPGRVEEPGDVGAERLVDDPELVVQKPLPDEDREESGDRERQHEQGALRPTQLELGLVEGDREEEADRELDEDGDEREDERPDEDADEGVANERIGEDRLEVLEADVGAPARLERLPRRRRRRSPRRCPGRPSRSRCP